MQNWYWRAARGIKITMFMALTGLVGCTSIQSQDAVPGDPLESVNRSVFAFNTALDEAIAQPIAQAYQAITPSFLDRAITNVFSNMGDVSTAVNNLLQFKFTNAIEDAARIAVNSTLGLGGLIDFASDAGITRHSEDFGQTLGYWGMGSGPYLVLPFLGPSTFRDAVGTGVDAVFLDPLVQLGGHDTLENGLTAVRIVDARADQLGSQAILGIAAWDDYGFVRDAFLQRRAYLIRDGAPTDDSY